MVPTLDGAGASESFRVFLLLETCHQLRISSQTSKALMPFFIFFPLFAFFSPRAERTRQGQRDSNGKPSHPSWCHRPRRSPFWDGSPWTLRPDGWSPSSQPCPGCGTPGPDGDMAGGEDRWKSRNKLGQMSTHTETVVFFSSPLSSCLKWIPSSSKWLIVRLRLSELNSAPERKRKTVTQITRISLSLIYYIYNLRIFACHVYIYIWDTVRINIDYLVWRGAVVLRKRTKPCKAIGLPKTITDVNQANIGKCNL